MGWDGLDGIRVVGGIEHLTVLIIIMPLCYLCTMVANTQILHHTILLLHYQLNVLPSHTKTGQGKKSCMKKSSWQKD